VVLCRELTLGTPSWDAVIAVVYLATMGLIGLRVAGNRIATLLLK
jgi:lipooligosaccharide transport system permease protein